MNELPTGPDTPAEFKRALRDATRIAGFDKLADLSAKTDLSRGTLSPAFSENQPMPTEATVAAIVQAIRGDVEAWLSRSRKVQVPSTSAENTVSVAAASSRTDESQQLSFEEVTGPPGMIDGDHRSGVDDNPPVRAKAAEPDSGAARAGRRGHHRHLVRGGIAAAAVVIAGLAAVVAWLLLRDDRTPERTVVVQNEVAIGASDLVEDKSPSYLAQRPIARCADMPGCKLAGTDLHTGDPVQAVCQLQGALLTNANVSSVGIKTNPNAAASTLWYGVKWTDGRRGYINEVYIAASYRGGLGLPGC